MDSRAEQILRRQAQLAAGRSNFESMWQQIAERMLPGSASFQTIRAPGEERTERVFDSTAMLALRKFATIIESITTPRNQKYHRLAVAEEALEEDQEVKRYLEDLNNLLFKVRYQPAANFAGQVGSVRLELGAFGTSSLFIDDASGAIRYRALPLAETYFAENHVGLIDTMFRKFTRTARQAVEQWPESCPREISEASAKSPDSSFCFVHAITPNTGAVRRDYRFTSEYVSETGRAVVQTGGYYTWPVAISRDLTSAGEIYGRSPGTWVLPDVKMLNEVNRTIVRVGHKMADPPVLTAEDGALSAFDMRPGHINPGGLGPNGEVLAKPFLSGAQPDVGVELMNAKQAIINEAFYITLFQILVDNPRMTATEVLERAQEKGMLLGPLAGRDQSEFLGPMVEREIDLLARAGRLPPIPDALAEAGGQYRIVYEGPLARAQRAEEGVAILRTMETTTQLAAVRPEVVDNFDLDQTVRDLAEINGMSAKLVRSKDDVDAVREARSQQQQAAMVMQAVPPAAKAVKDLSQAAAA